LLPVSACLASVGICPTYQAEVVEVIGFPSSFFAPCLLLVNWGADDRPLRRRSATNRQVMPAWHIASFRGAAALQPLLE
jgi:hypothetical protein